MAARRFSPGGSHRQAGATCLCPLSVTLSREGLHLLNLQADGSDGESSLPAQIWAGEPTSLFAQQVRLSAKSPRQTKTSWSPDIYRSSALTWGSPGPSLMSGPWYSLGFKVTGWVSLGSAFWWVRGDYKAARI